MDDKKMINKINEFTNHLEHEATVRLNEEQAYYKGYVQACEDFSRRIQDAIMLEKLDECKMSRSDRNLYKAKRLDNGEWREGYLFFSWERAYILWGTTNDIPNMVEVDPSTLCQCTGLTDKNDKLIWENEKCLITSPCTCAGVHIIYKDACFCGYDKLFGTLIKLCDLKVNGYEIEVVSATPEIPEVEK